MHAFRQSIDSRALRAIATAIFVAALTACGGGVPDTTPPGPPLPPAGFGTIGPSGGTVQGVDGATVVVPPGALPEATTIVIARDASEAPPLPSALRPVGGIYAVTPHGTQFSLDATVNIPFNPAFLRAGERPILLKGDPDGDWTVVRGVTVRDGMMTAKVNGFSLFVPTACAEGDVTVGCGFNPEFIVQTPGQAVFGLDPLNSNLPTLIPTGSDVRIRQQQDASEPVRVQVSWNIPASSNMVSAACRSPSTLSVGLRLTPGLLYSITGQPGSNRLLLSETSATTDVIDASITPPELGRQFLVERSINVADYAYGANGTLLQIPPLPPGGVRDGSAVQVSLEVRCRDAATGSSVLLPTGITPLVIGRGFADSPLNITEQPRPLYGRLAAGASPRTGLMSTSVKFEFPIGEFFQDGDVRWELAMPGLAQFSDLPQLSSVPGATATNLPSSVDGFFANGERVVGRTGTWANGARLRATACVVRRTNPSQRVCVTSLPAPVTVAASFEPPRFTTQPLSRTMSPGSQLTVRAAFEGLPTPAEVTWLARTSDGLPWTDARTQGFYVLMDPGSPADTRGATRLVRRDSVVAGQAWQLRATYTTAGGTADSEVANIVVGATVAPPVLTLQPRDQQVAPGGRLALAASARGGFPLSYQWYFNFTPIPGATGPSYTVNGFAAAAAGSYQVEAVNAAGRVSSRSAAVSVGTATPPGAPPPPARPEIIQQPAAVSTAAGTNASFAVTLASNPLVPAYQWRLNGSAIAGATLPTLTLPSVTPGLAGDYSVTITNSAGSVTSATARLTVQASSANPVPPALTAEPTGLAVALGQSARLAVAAIGSAPLSYQWQRNGVNLPGATAPTLTLVASGSAQAGDYTVIVTNSAGSVTSTPAGVAVLPPVVRIDGLLPQTVEVGTAASFAARVVANEPATCQWLRNDVPLLDATSCSSLTTPPATAADNGATYTLRATAGSQIATASAVLSTFTTTVPPLTMALQPPSLLSMPSRIGRVEFTAAAVPRAGQGIIGWEFRNKDVTNLSCAEAEAFGRWFPQIETVTPGPERRLLFERPDAPSSVFLPYLCQVSASVSADGSTLSLKGATLGCDAASGWNGICVRYRMRDAYADEGVKSNWVRFNVTPHFQMAAPPSAAATEGGSVTLTTSVLGLDSRPDPVDEQGQAIAPTLTWGVYVSGANEWRPFPDSAGQRVELVAGSNCRAIVAYASGGKELRLSNISAACHDAGFVAEGNDLFNRASSDRVGGRLSIDTLPAITTAPTPQNALSGGTAVFVSTASGRPFPTMGWRINGQPIAAGAFDVGACRGVAALSASSGNNDGRLTLSDLTLGCNGSTVSVVATNRAGSSAPSAATLTVNPAGTAPSITQPPLAQSTSAGGTATFAVEATGTPTPAFAWTLNGTAIGNGAFNLAGCTGTAATSNGGATLTLTALSVQCSGAAIGVTASNGIAPNATAAATLTVTAPPVFTQPPLEQRIAEGGGATFTAIASGNPAPTYAWTLNGSPVGSGPFTAGACSLVAVTSAGGSTLSLTGVTAGCDNALMRVTASNGINPSPQASARLRVGLRAPVITQAPLSQTIPGGTSVSFTVTATANPPPTYAWTFNGQPIAEGPFTVPGFSTSVGPCRAVAAFSNGGATLTLADVRNECSFATVTVTVSNGIAPNAPRSANLTVTPASLTVIERPQDQRTIEGGSATFRFVVAPRAGSSSPVAYEWYWLEFRDQWRFSNGSFEFRFGSGPACSGSAAITQGGSTLTLSNLSRQCDRSIIHGRASDGTLVASSGGNSLFVDEPAAPQITQPPLAQSISAGGGATFAVTATGTPTPTYAWTLNGTAVGSGAFTLGSCSGSAATSNGGATLSLTAVSAGCNSAAVAVTVSNGVSPNATASTTLAVITPAAPAITAQPASATLTAGGNAALAVTFTGTPAPTAAWWYRSSTLPEPRLVTATASPTPFTAGTCQFNASGTQTAGSAALSMAAVTLGCDGAQIRAIATNSQGSATSDWATLTVNPPNVAPTITQPPLAQTITAGGGATFMVTATGTPTPTYAWTLNGTAVGSGAFTLGSCTGSASTSNGGATLSLTTVALACNGFLVGVTASNVAGTSAPASATLTVNPAGTPPAITAQPAAASTTVGGSANFSVSATGSGTLSYAWTLNSSLLPGSGTFTVGLCTGSLVSSNGGENIALAGLAAGCNGAAISVTVSNGVNPNAVSNTVTITVNQAATPGARFGGPSGWGYANPQPQAGGLTGLVYTASTSTFTAVGEAGTTVRTGDSGASWQVAFEAGRTSFTDLASPAPGVLVAAGAPPLGSGKGSGVFRSTDGGQTWSQRLDAGSPGQLAVTKLAFADALFGVAAGPLGVWRTEDGGSSWTPVNNAPATQFVVSGDFGGVAWADTDVVLIYGGFGKILRSADRGVTWADVSPAGFFDNWRDMAFNATGVGVAVGPNGKVARSTDRGANWQEVATPMTEPGTAVAFANSSTVVVMGNLFRAMRSTDAGETWAAGSGFFGASSQFRLRFASPTVGLAVSAIGGLTLRTDDGGATWTRVGGGTLDEQVIGMAASPSGTVVLAGSLDRDLLRSADGGATWARAPGSYPGQFRFQKPSFATEQRVIAMRPAGQIALSLDAGQTWNTRYDQLGQVLLADTTMASADIGLVVGNNGLILRSNDGGSSWTAVASGTTLPLKSVGCLTATVCLAGGGVFLRSTDAGNTWSVAPFPVTGFSQIRAIARVNNTTAVLAADDGLWRSDNAGVTWTRVYTPTGGSQLGVSFNAAGIGIATGYDGILRSTDQGLTWVAQPIPAPSYLNAVTWVTPTTVLVGGDGGAILRNLQAGAP